MKITSIMKRDATLSSGGDGILQVRTKSEKVGISQKLPADFGLEYRLRLRLRLRDKLH